MDSKIIYERDEYILTKVKYVEDVHQELFKQMKESGDYDEEDLNLIQSEIDDNINQIKDLDPEKLVAYYNHPMSLTPVLQDDSTVQELLEEMEEN